ncbi:MAG TPA: phosphoenolpyruvate synthase [Actinobacteria bacterium]|nr:phosphoenolpyruvate synthase [Actinomycetota bacterium]
MARYVRWFEELGLDDVGLVGGKNASLGELYRNLAGAGVRVPNGFAVTAEAYREALRRAEAWERLEAVLAGIDKSDLADFSRRAHAAREIVYGAGIPDEVRVEILEAYHRLGEQYGPDLSVAVRSSATAEDLPGASFAGQQETFLNVRGDEQLLDACRRCWASLFTDRAISYRIDQGFDHLAVALSVGIMKMVRSDLASSGVMFTLDTETGFRDVVFVTGAWGLGENVVQGTVEPDEFYVHKPTYERGYRAVLRRRLGAKTVKMVLAPGGHGATTRNVPTPRADQDRFCLSDDEVLELAGQAIAVERHYSERAGRPTPMDLEWAKDGLDGLLYLVQARPETVASRRRPTVVEEYRITGSGEVLVTGRAVGTKVAVGEAHWIPDVQRLVEFRPGEVLVADTTTPDWEPVMKDAAAIVTNRGGRTCHAAIVARELGIPAVVGAGNATEVLREVGTVTVSCAEGDVGKVYRGTVPFEVHRIDVAELPRPKTKVMVNLGNPDVAFAVALLPSDGVGLARMEFIINERIRAHPMALVHPDRLDEETRRRVEELARHDPGLREFFVRELSEGIGTIAAAFYPRPVVVRMSDFKSNEYAGLLGGAAFEPEEENPMLGFRGAARYVHPAYAEGFALECAAMRRVRETMGLDNVRLMVPFCRRLDEADRVLEAMASHGLVRGEGGLEIYVMCEIPNNVVLIDEFAARFDGISIGSNDLTQLVLGVDRDSEVVAFEFDERDPGVLEMIRLAVEGARRAGRHSGICGQAPSDHPEFAEFLVELGIDSISLNPDVVVQTTMRILDLEARRGR